VEPGGGGADVVAMAAFVFIYELDTVRAHAGCHLAGGMMLRSSPCPTLNRRSSPHSCMSIQPEGSHAPLSFRMLVLNDPLAWGLSAVAATTISFTTRKGHTSTVLDTRSLTRSLTIYPWCTGVSVHARHIFLLDQATRFLIISSYDSAA
jgi:hypothetical protein